MGVDSLLLLLNFLCYSGHGLRIPLPADIDGDPQGEVSIVVRDGGDKLLRSLEGASIPSKSLEISFPLRRNHVTLHLVRNDEISTNVPLYTMNDDGFITRESIDDDQNTFLYQDISNGAGVLVQTIETSYCLFGSFYVDEEEFFLEPTQRYCTDTSINSTFRVWKVNLSGLQFSDVTGDDHFDYTKPLSRKHDLRFKRNIQDLKVETLFIIDYSIYSYWLSKVTVDDEAERSQAAKSAIRQFYAFVINGMDVRYKNIPSTSSSFTLSVVFAGIYIADTASKSPFTEDQKISSTSPTQAYAYSVLNHTTLWIQQAAGIPEFDHAMMFSRYDFTHNDSSSVVGMAWSGAMCTQNSVSIVEDHFNFIVLTVAAHELGHSLNASHDGTDNTCSSAEMYVMAPFVDVQRGLLNSWNFSTCSIQYFTDFITNLNEEGNNCLRTLRSGYDPTALVPEISTLPGTLYDADEHCRHIVGEGSYFCRYPYNNEYSDICTILYCHVINETSCNAYLGGDGLSCGDKKWCISGVCTSSESAPPGNEKCLYGDDPDFRLVNSTVDNCQGNGNSVQRNPALCYEESVEMSCCKTCSNLYTGISGCEFGDKNSNCTSLDCNVNADVCCQTCLASTISTLLTAETTVEITAPPASLTLTPEVTEVSISPTLPTTLAITNTETYSTSTSLTSSKSLATSPTATGTTSPLSSTSTTSAPLTTITSLTTSATLLPTSTPSLAGSTTSSQPMSSSTPPPQTSLVTTSTTSPATIKTPLTSTTSLTTSTATSPTTTSTATSLTTSTATSPTTTSTATSLTTSTATSPTTTSTTSPTTISTATSPTTTSTTSPTTISTATSPTTLSTATSPMTTSTATSPTTTRTATSLTTSTTTSPTTITTTSPTTSTTTSPTTITTTSSTTSTTTKSIQTTSVTTTKTSTQTSTSLSTQTASTTTPLSTTTSPSTLTPTTQRKLNFQITLNVEERRNIVNTEEYTKVLNDSKKALTDLYTDKLGESFISVEIESLRIGSLIVNHTIYVVNSPPTLLNVVSVMKNISEGKTNVTYNGNDVNALSVSYTDSSNNQVLINERTDSDAVIDASFICDANGACYRDSSTTKADNGLTDSEIIIIASVSAVVGLMITVAIVIIICTCRRKPKKTPTTTNREFKHFLFSKNTTDLLDSSRTFQNVAMDNMPSMGHHDDIKNGQYARVNRVPSRQRDVYETGYDVLETTAIGQNDSYSASDSLRDDRTQIGKPDGYRTGRAIADSNISNEQLQDFRTNHGASYDREPRKQTGRIQNTQLDADFRVNQMIQNRRPDAYRNNYGASEVYNTSGGFTPNHHTRDDAIASRKTDIYRAGYNSKVEKISNIHQGNTRYNSRETGVQSRYPDASGSRYTGNYRERMVPSSRSEFDVRTPRDKSRGNVTDKSHDRSHGNVANRSHDISRGNGAEYGRRWYPGYEQYLSENDLWKPPGSSRYIDK